MELLKLIIILCNIVLPAQGYTFTCGADKRREMFNVCKCTYFGSSRGVMADCTETSDLSILPTSSTRLTKMMKTVDMTGTVFCYSIIYAHHSPPDVKYEVLCQGISTGYTHSETEQTLGLHTDQTTQPDSELAVSLTSTPTRRQTRATDLPLSTYKKQTELATPGVTAYKGHVQDTTQVVATYSTHAPQQDFTPPPTFHRSKSESEHTSTRALVKLLSTKNPTDASEKKKPHHNQIKPLDTNVTAAEMLQSRNSGFWSKFTFSFTLSPDTCLLSVIVLYGIVKIGIKLHKIYKRGRCCRPPCQTTFNRGPVEPFDYFYNESFTMEPADAATLTTFRNRQE